MASPEPRTRRISQMLLRPRAAPRLGHPTRIRVPRPHSPPTATVLERDGARSGAHSPPLQLLQLLQFVAVRCVSLRKNVYAIRPRITQTSAIRRNYSSSSVLGVKGSVVRIHSPRR